MGKLSTITVTRRTTFNLQDFLERLLAAIEDRPDLIEEEVERFEGFLKRASEDIRDKSFVFLLKSDITKENKEVKSYIIHSFARGYSSDY